MQRLSRLTGATIDVLTVLATSSEPSWGLAIIKSSGRPAGSVYPILDRLESAGWLSSRWEDDSSRPGPRRRYYEFTKDGASAAHIAMEAFATRRGSAAPKPVTA